MVNNGLVTTPAFKELQQISRDTLHTANDGWLRQLAPFTNNGLTNPRGASLLARAGFSMGPGHAEELYEGNGVAKLVIELPSGDMTRQWIKYSGDTDNKISTYLSKINARQEVRNLVRWSDLYGGAVMLLVVDDGQEFDQPINFDNIKSFIGMRVFDRHAVSWSSADLYQGGPKFGTPEYFNLNPYNGTSQRVHASRVIKLDGAPLPPRRYYQNGQWGDSVLKSVEADIQHLCRANVNIGSILEDFVQSVLSISNLADVLSAPEGELRLKKKIETLDLSRSVLNMMVIDDTEKYTKQSSSVSGIDGLVDRLQIMVSAVTQIPVTRLFGVAPAGLNSTGEGDMRNYYDRIKSDQQDKLFKPLLYLTKLVCAAKDAEIKITETMPQPEFCPLKQLDEKTQAEIRQIVANTDAAYIDRGVLGPVEVGVNRFGGESYSTETTLARVETRDSSYSDIQALANE